MAKLRSFTQPKKITLSNNIKTTSQLNQMLIEGYSFHQKGQFKKAQKIYDEILALQPKHFDLLQVYGALALQMNQLDKAVTLLSESIEINPYQSAVYFNLALAFEKLKKYDTAVENYYKAIKLNTNHTKAYFNCAILLAELQQFEAAIANYDQAIRLNPNLVEAFYHRGNSLQAIKQFEAAITNYNEAIRLNPNLVEAICDRGNALQAIKQFEAAITNYNEAIRLNPNFAVAYCNRGNALLALNQIDAAIGDYKQAIKLNPDYSVAFHNHAYLMYRLQEFEASIESYDQAIRLNPNFAEAYCGKGLVKILLGQYEDGWALYEWRWRGSHLKEYIRNFSQPLWLGKESIKDKIILIHTEQGLGDSIQFCRYMGLVEALSPKQILLEAPKALLSLLSTLKNNVTLIEQGNPIPEFDVHCPLLSLPYAFKTTSETIPANIPYLYSEEKKTKLWKDKLGLKIKPRVGIVWSGSSNNIADDILLSRRNIPLERLTSLFELPFEFHLLQKEIRQEDQLVFDSLTQINSYQDELIDFSDTTALIMQMDLVISTCTSVVHLAGALGVKTWVLLPYSADFRWMLDRNDSPWYPTATLFRQPEIDDWESVIDQVKIALVNSNDLALGDGD